MPEPLEDELVSSLIAKTEQNRLEWQPTAQPTQYTASFAGKYTILLSYSLLGATTILQVKNVDGDALVHLTNLNESRLPTLYGLARDYVKKQIDDQLTDLLKEIDKSPSPERLVDKVRALTKAEALRALRESEKK